MSPVAAAVALERPGRRSVIVWAAAVCRTLAGGLARPRLRP
jgi:hypothetical protein